MLDGCGVVLIKKYSLQFYWEVVNGDGWTRFDPKSVKSTFVSLAYDELFAPPINAYAKQIRKKCVFPYLILKTRSFKNDHLNQVELKITCVSVFRQLMLSA